MHNTTSKLHPISLGLAMGLMWGGSLFFLTLACMWWGFGNLFIQIVATIYIGFEPTLLGAFIGFLYGFVDVFVLGFLIAVIYNACRPKGCAHDCSEDDGHH